MLVLTVLQGPDKGRKYQLPPNEPQLIGRSSEALPITDDTVSRRHAELTPDAGIWWIRDLQSQNGSYVNGLKIDGRQRLKAGDQIRTGSTLFVFGQDDTVDADAVQLLRKSELDFSIERSLPSNEDSVILAEPEPAAAAVDHLRIIYQLTTLTTQVMDRQQLLESVLDLVFQEFEPERGFIMLAGDTPDAPMKPAVVKYKNKPASTTDAKIGVSRTILQHVLKNSEGVLSSNAMTDKRFASGDSVQQYHIRSAICSPIRFQDRVFGVVYIDSSIANYTFTEQQLALMNAIGQHTGLALANADHYGQKLHAERLTAAGETVASLSHSIKNILQGLRGGADVVEMGLRKSDLNLSMNGWGILKRNLDRIVGLTMNMLTFSRQHGVELALEPLGLLVEDCAQLLESRCKQKGVAVIVDHDPEMPPVPIDGNLIHQALMNLLSNAVEAVPSGTGVVTVRTMFRTTDPLLGQGHSYAEFHVIDNGPGIPADRQRWIFEPFNTTKGTKGTGLGLAVTKRIIDEHRGQIHLESSEGKGTTFRVVLPADTPEGLDPSATAQSRADPGNAGA
ncbi:MAG: FHA domain-containing protein [Planctomycetota bacterium]|nr:MAG: FHA domain-containing protein [Planctomycetota bacterium]